MKITVCGSIAFYGEMEKLQEALEVKGHEVRIPLLSNESPAMGGDRKTYFGKYIEDNGGIDAFPVGHALRFIKELTHLLTGLFTSVKHRGNLKPVFVSLLIPYLIVLPKINPIQERKYLS